MQKLLVISLQKFRNSFFQFLVLKYWNIITLISFFFNVINFFLIWLSWTELILNCTVAYMGTFVLFYSFLQETFQVLLSLVTYNWQLPLITGSCQFCEEPLIILLFVKSEKNFLHKTNKRVKFFMADTRHRIIAWLAKLN